MAQLGGHMFYIGLSRESRRPRSSRMVVVSYKRKYVQEVLVNCLVKLAQKKSVVR